MVLLATVLTLSACQQFNNPGSNDRRFTQSGEKTSRISTSRVLACLSSSNQLSAKSVKSEFDTLVNSWETNPVSTNLDKLLCLSLHHHSSQKQLMQGENILAQFLQKNGSGQQDINGLLRVFQGKIELHKQYLDMNWKLHLENKKISKQNDTERATCQRRIQDLEKQVQKLIEIESMLDQKVQP